MLSVQINKKSTNPFYGMRNCLNLFQNAGKVAPSTSQLDACLAECKTKEQKEMLYSLLFSFGDITGRHHNLFGKSKIDSGGNSNKDAFAVIVQWIKKNNRKQWLKFLNNNIFNEYVSFDVLLANRIRTKKKTNKVEAVVQAYDKKDIEDLSGYLKKIVNGKSPFDKMLLAKFLTRPRTSKRAGHKKILPQTLAAAKLKAELIESLSKEMSWAISNHGKFKVFDGYYNWRKEYNGELESVLFSSGKVKEFDETEFKNWLNKLPAGARYRVKRRLFDAKGTINEKWLTQAKWFQQWETFKTEAQASQRKLEEKVRQGTATEKDVETLVKVKKEAKVTVGANNFKDMFVDIINGNVDKIKIQPFLDKIKLPYNNLVFADDSGSMNSIYNGLGFSARQFASFIATICLMKNPDDVGRSMIGLFSNRCRMFTSIDKEVSAPNSIIKTVAKKVAKPLINPEDHFLDNVKAMKKFFDAHSTGNGTNISSIPEDLNRWIDGDPVKLEALQQYPVWTLISDGNFNNLGGASSSLNDFFRKCQNYFGFKPFVVAIDVATYSSAAIDQFSGIENFMFIPPNPAQIEQFLTNFKDIDIMDVYTPLESMYRSNRYEMVRKNVLA